MQSGDAAIAACIDVLCEFEAIEFLRSQRGLTVTKTRAAMIAGVTSLLRD